MGKTKLQSQNSYYNIGNFPLQIEVITLQTGCYVQVHWIKKSEAKQPTVNSE